MRWPKCVDCHAHVYTTDMPLAGTAWHKPPHDATIEQYVATLDAHGVQYGVLAAASIYGTYNDYTINALRKYPDRLRGTIIADPSMDRYLLERMKADGVVGIRLQRRNVANPPDLTSPEYRMLLRRVADLDWHVHLYDDSPRLPQPLAALEEVGVKIVVDHFGKPDPLKGIHCEGFQAVLRSVERGRTWVKMSSGFRIGPPELAQQCAPELLKAVGAERLFWGSDWPFAAFESQVTYQDTLNSFEAWVPDPNVRQRIGETAFNFYFPP